MLLKLVSIAERIRYRTLAVYWEKHACGSSMNKNALKWKVCRLADILKHKRKKEKKTNKNFQNFSVIYNYQLFIIKAQKVSQKCVQQSSKLFSAGIATICHHRKRKIQKQKVTRRPWNLSMTYHLFENGNTRENVLECFRHFLKILADNL